MLQSRPAPRPIRPSTPAELAVEPGGRHSARRRRARAGVLAGALTLGVLVPMTFAASADASGSEKVVTPARFARTVTSGLGVADKGGAWPLTSPDVRASVAHGAG